MVLEKNFFIQLTNMEKKGPFIQRMPSVSSVCLVYDERMSNVLLIRSYTLKFFEHVQKIF